MWAYLGDISDQLYPDRNSVIYIPLLIYHLYKAGLSISYTIFSQPKAKGRDFLFLNLIYKLSEESGTNAYEYF